MTYLKNFNYSPGGENESGNDTPDSNEDPKESLAETPVVKEAAEEEKPVIEKVREALQDWANKDEADLEFDDTRV